MMQVHTLAHIEALEPCYDPVERGYCTRDWTGTALDVLRHPDVPAQDKLWLVLRESWIPAPVLHECACQCAERALALVDTPDPRSVAAIATKRAWLRGEATDDELAAARDAARAAARAAAQDAAQDAARAAAQDAALAAWDAQVDLLIALLAPVEA